MQRSRNQHEVSHISLEQKTPLKSNDQNQYNNYDMQIFCKTINFKWEFEKYIAKVSNTSGLRNAHIDTSLIETFNQFRDATRKVQVENHIYSLCFDYCTISFQK